METTWGATCVRVSGPAGAAPLVLLPGAGVSGLMWIPNIGALAEHFQTYAVDQVGDFGRSIASRPMGQYSDVVAWLGEVLDGLQLRDGVNLMGISYGGALVAEYARLFPSRVAKVVMLAPAATVLGLRTVFMMRLMAAIFSRRKALRSVFRWMFADTLRKDPGAVDAVLVQLYLVMDHVMRKLPNPRVWPDAEWAGLRVPALLLVGEHEVIYSASRAVERLRRVAPGVQAEVLPGAGHDLAFVQAESVNARVVAFLRA